MKKSLVLLLSLALFTSCKKENNDANLHITGQVKGFSVGKLYLEKASDSGFVKIDSVLIDGKDQFAFHINIEEPEMLYLKIDRGTTNSIDDKIPFFAEPGNMTIHTDLKQFFANAKIEGSTNHDLYSNFKQINSKFNNQNLEYTKHILNAQKHHLQAKLDSIISLQNGNIKRQYLYAINFAVTNKDKAVAPYITLTEIPDANVKFLDTIYKSLSPEIASSKYGKVLDQYLSDLKKN